MAESDEKIGLSCDALIPKLGHCGPVAAHAAGCVDQASDDFALFGGGGLDFGDAEEGVGEMCVLLHILCWKQIFDNYNDLFLL